MADATNDMRFIDVRVHPSLSDWEEATKQLKENVNFQTPKRQLYRVSIPASRFDEFLMALTRLSVHLSWEEEG
jgi:hypothetical protein